MKCQTQQAHLITAVVHAVGDIKERCIEYFCVFIDAYLAKFFYDEQSSTAIICGLDIDRPVESAGDIAPFVKKWDGECRSVDGSFSSRWDFRGQGRCDWWYSGRVCLRSRCCCG